jgi:hypothetical protein
MRINIPNARLSFPNLFKTAVFGGEDTEKYDSTFILDKTDHKAVIQEIQDGIKTLVKEHLKGKMPDDDKICLKDGDETERPEQQGCYVIKASTKRRPFVVDRDKTPVTAEDEVIYAGCYVNGIITLWVQNNAYGKRVNASLDGVQFAGHGEPFGPPAIEADAFDVFASEDEVF